MPRSLSALALVLGTAAIVAGLHVSPGAAARIEAVQGKRYVLTKKHGPWTIMVASFQDIPTERVEYFNGEAKLIRNEDHKGGTSAQEAADQLVYELRSYGIPAYTYEQKAEYDKATTVDRMRRMRSRTYTAKKRSVAVLAGNYRSASDDSAQQTLKLVKQFQPRFLSGGGGGGGGGFTTHSATGGIFRPTPGQPSPLSGAFLSTNPLLTAVEARQMAGKRDPLLLKLNSGVDHCLLKNEGKYTVLVAAFWGNSQIQGQGKFPTASRAKSEPISSLDTAAASANQMCRYMRTRNTEAYVLHERYRSIVTVGAFDSPNDPRIPQLIRFFGPKPIVDPRTGARTLKYEVLTIPKAARDGGNINLPIDPNPHAMEVPRL